MNCVKCAYSILEQLAIPNELAERVDSFLDLMANYKGKAISLGQYDRIIDESRFWIYKRITRENYNKLCPGLHFILLSGRVKTLSKANIFGIPTIEDIFLEDEITRELHVDLRRMINFVLTGFVPYNLEFTTRKYFAKPHYLVVFEILERICREVKLEYLNPGENPDKAKIKLNFGVGRLCVELVYER